MGQRGWVHLGMAEGDLVLQLDGLAPPADALCEFAVSDLKGQLSCFLSLTHEIKINFYHLAWLLLVEGEDMAFKGLKFCSLIKT